VQNIQFLPETVVVKNELDRKFLVLALEQLVELILQLELLHVLQEVKYAGETGEFLQQRP